jgi:bifunctional DNA-binding transcriptional regulator/antitoxin component of YhaV-PrlF toxin-antitoxin module
MNEQYGLTTIIVTHDPQAARTVDRVVTIRDGSTSSETVRRVSDVEAALVQGAQDVSAAMHIYDEYVMVDRVGRLQIPPELRRELNIGGRVTLERADGGILIRPVDGFEAIEVSEEQGGDEPDEDAPSPRAKGLVRWMRGLRR